MKEIVYTFNGHLNIIEEGFIEKIFDDGYLIMPLKSERMAPILVPPQNVYFSCDECIAALNADKESNIGCWVYFTNKYFPGVNIGMIQEKKDSNYIIHIGEGRGRTSVPTTDVFFTSASCKNFIHVSTRREVNQYKSIIHTTRDLLLFPTRLDLTSNSTALAAYKESVKELLGVEI